MQFIRIMAQVVVVSSRKGLFLFTHVSEVTVNSS